jgi:hypothetical protein
MLITQAGLGLRIAELLALRVQGVDLLRQTVRIESLALRDGSAGSTQTPRSRRMLACRTSSPSAATARQKVPREKPGRCGGQTSTAGSITATS